MNGKNIEEKYNLMLHSRRVSILAFRVAIEMGLDEIECKEISIAAELHDIGKLILNTSILNKENKVSNEEKEYLCQHVKYSYMIGMFFQDKLSSNIIDMIYQHHENCDGTGYPNNLHEKELNIGSQIIRVCDAYDALRSDRPYRKGMGNKAAFAFMEKQQGIYNRECLKILSKIEKLESIKVAI